jgi:iron complex outermembrane recepter protein
MRDLKLRALWLLPLSVQAAGALAVESNPAQDELADIIVTARKSDERLQNVPISVDAISGDALEKNGVRDLKDELLNIPGISYQGVDRGFSYYNIRGISTSQNSPTVGIYLDDIALNTVGTDFSGAFDPVFFDMQRLEVLKGPQGTLYGGSALGGAIKYVSRRPSVAGFSADATGGAAFTHDGEMSYNGSLVLNLPLTSDLAFRGGIYYRRDGGYIDNIPDGTVVNRSVSTVPLPGYEPLAEPSLSMYRRNNANSSTTVAARSSLLWSPDSATTVLASAFYQDYELASLSRFFTNLPDLTSSYRFSQPLQDKDGVYSLTIDRDIGPTRLTSLTGYFSRHHDLAPDYSFFIGNLVPAFYDLNSFDTTGTRTDTFSQELRLSSNTQPGDRLTWVGGLYFSRQSDRLIETVTTQGASAIPGIGTNTTYYGNTETITKQYAAFGEVTYEVIPRLKLTAGARAFSIKINVDAAADGLFNGGPSASQSRSSEDGVDPKFGVAYQATDDSLVYTTASKGFRPGGPNRLQVSRSVCGPDLDALGLNEAPSSYSSDDLWTYELGSKNQFVDRRVTLNGAVYYTDWKKIQQLVQLPGCGFNFTGNVGSATVKGIELESAAKPLDSLLLGVTGSFTDAELTSTLPGSGAQPGDEVQSVPKWMASAYAEQSLVVMADWRLSLRLDYQYQGRARLSSARYQPAVYPDGSSVPIANLAEFRDSYRVINSQLILDHGPVNVRLYANNIGNVRPLIDFRTDHGLDESGTLRPRTVGFDVGYKY